MKVKIGKNEEEVKVGIKGRNVVKKMIEVIGEEKIVGEDIEKVMMEMEKIYEKGGRGESNVIKNKEGDLKMIDER